jgi:hypothetical protein
MSNCAHGSFGIADCRYDDEFEAVGVGPLVLFEFGHSVAPTLEQGTHESDVQTEKKHAIAGGITEAIVRPIK